MGLHRIAGLCGMKRVSMLIIASLFVVTLLSSVTSVDAAIGLQWSFEEGDFIDFRLISEGMVEDEIISFRIDSPLPDTCELPPDTYSLGALNDWMEIPLVPVTAFIPVGSSTTEESGFEYIFTYGGLAAGYWCRFALPSVSESDFESLVGGWTDGPHGPIETNIIYPPVIHQNLYMGFEYGFEFSGTNYNVTTWYYQNNLRLANVTITGHDSSTQAQTHHMMMVSDYEPPVVAAHPDLNFTAGSPEKEINWLTHDYPPYGYEVFRNGTPIQSGEFSSTNHRAIVSLDDLEVGVWNFTIVVTDFLLNSVTDTVMVTVNSNFAIGSETLLIVGGVGSIVIIGAVVMKRRR